jgi:hypothetical protein
VIAESTTMQMLTRMTLLAEHGIGLNECAVSWFEMESNTQSFESESSSSLIKQQEWGQI